MKKHHLIIACMVLFLSCAVKKKHDSEKPKENGSVTFIIKQLPKQHDSNKDLFISGNFEGWSGGQIQFKLHKSNTQYGITIPRPKETISYKFTLGNWDDVECAIDGNPIENRTFNPNKENDTIEIAILNWNDKKQQYKTSTAAKNVHVFAENFEIPQLNRTRKISMYLPPNYETSNSRYPVLYMQDGQNVFDIATSFSGEWEVDETLNNMYKASGFGLIVVAIDHGGDKRFLEYSAWDNKEYGKGEAALYLEFLVNSLKPQIDKAYRTKPDNKNTAIMGSSLGGLFAHYAALKRSDVFGKAGVFSPSFWFATESFDFTKAHSNLKESKLYYLAGGNEGSHMASNMFKMTTLMKAHGFPEQNIYEKVVPDGTHSESFWKTEFEQVIEYLFSK